jgi:AraC family ethanolamine operon transcriptional activator
MEGTTLRTSEKRGAARASWLAAVERAEAYQRAHLGSSIPISTLCQIVGLSERGFRDAFYRVRGMSPKRYLIAVRLKGVRTALREAGARPATVTGVATDYGFYELGRFAASYKAAFGEIPSKTLRSARPIRKHQG